jgi:hypothetical protein
MYRSRGLRKSVIENRLFTGARLRADILPGEIMAIRNLGPCDAECAATLRAIRNLGFRGTLRRLTHPQGMKM